MKVLITPDVEGWAIGNLTDAIIRHNRNRFNFTKICVHPRGITENYLELADAIQNKGIDLWHAQYWNSAIQLMDTVKGLNDIPSLLTHHNHHCLEKQDWNKFTLLNEMTDWGVDKLKEKHPNVVKIPHGIDLDRYEYNDRYIAKKTVGYIGRVVPWKHLKEICEAANKLHYKVIGSGYIDKADYWDTIDKTNLEFNGGIGRNQMAPAGFKDSLYDKMAVFVMYSTGEKESGTLPLLEAMAKGVPVMATKQGMARDLIKDGKNGIIFDENNFEKKLKDLMENQELREKIRKNAWQTIKLYSEEKMARNYAKAYYKTVFGSEKIVSVVIPTNNRSHILWDIIKSIDEQDYKAKEIIIVNDNPKDKSAKQICSEIKNNIFTPVIYLETDSEEDEYGLAKARNLGAIESLGDILLFLDDRYALEKDALGNIVKNSSEKTFICGQKIIKGKLSNKKDFVENFAWINRKDFFNAGMFNERINVYGGMSQEVRTRFDSQSFTLKQDTNVKCQQLIDSKSGKIRKDSIWKAKFLLNKMYD